MNTHLNNEGQKCKTDPIRGRVESLLGLLAKIKCRGRVEGEGEGK
jgi:hypothetical protein